MRYFVRQSITIGRRSVLKQNYKSIISDEVFKKFSKQLDPNSNTCEVLDKNFEFTKKHKKIRKLI